MSIKMKADSPYAIVDIEPSRPGEAISVRVRMGDTKLKLTRSQAWQMILDVRDVLGAPIPLIPREGRQ